MSQSRYMQARSKASARLREAHRAEFDTLMVEERAKHGLVSRAERARQRKLSRLAREIEALSR